MVDIESLQPRIAVGVGLLALLPVLWYAVGRPSVWGYVTAVSVLIIVAALYIATRPVIEQPNESHGTS